MIRNETYGADGLISAEVIDLEAGTLTVEDGNGEVIHAARPLTEAEIQRYTEPGPSEEEVVQQQAEQALAGMVIAISEDPEVSPTTRAWAMAWRQTVGI